MNARRAAILFWVGLALLPVAWVGMVLAGH